MRTKLTSLAARVLIFVVGPVLLLFSPVLVIHTLRLRDARPALNPLLPLGAEISSAPVLLSRKCAYFVFFEPAASLSDANAEALLSLNRLPEGNSVFLYIQSPAVTDSSLPVLARLGRVRRLQVVDSGISDAGIDRLQRELPEAEVWKR